MAKAINADAKCEQKFEGGSRPPIAFCSDPFGNGFCVVGPTDTANLSQAHVCFWPLADIPICIAHVMNLISNGFYAATKRRAEADGDGYEPTLVASTRSLGDRVEIRVRDNGTGIPTEVKEKMFNPFFTTKPAGEGTGLGLSICHDIIVKQHGGSIEVDTQPGEFTEIRVILPRSAALFPERS